MTYETAISIILLNYPEKTRDWAEYQLDRAVDNCNCDNYEEILKLVFDIYS